MQTGQVVSTLVQVVSTQCFKCKAKRSGSVDTSSGGVDTRDSSQNTFWPIWDIVFYTLTGHVCEISLARLRSVHGRRIWIWSLIKHKYPGPSQTLSCSSHSDPAGNLATCNKEPMLT
ncbi:hypothetical protein Taro_029884 [Colocasia esculenta]|uniref:Uncharacterized protein n=1 Tax=Colocasia esculenta TaxID=4460 RepID=A0A843W1M4_COLES|nr:hypothetical protein [Colocasia esculenta]